MTFNKTFKNTLVAMLMTFIGVAFAHAKPITIYIIFDIDKPTVRSIKMKVQSEKVTFENLRKYIEGMRLSLVKNEFLNFGNKIEFFSFYRTIEFGDVMNESDPGLLFSEETPLSITDESKTLDELNIEDNSYVLFTPESEESVCFTANTDIKHTNRALGKERLTHTISGTAKKFQYPLTTTLMIKKDICELVKQQIKETEELHGYEIAQCKVKILPK